MVPVETIFRYLLQQAKAPNLKLVNNITFAVKRDQDYGIEDLFGLLNEINQSLCAENQHMKVLVQDEWQFVSAGDHWIPWVVALQNRIRGKATVDIPDDPRQRGVFQIATVRVAIGQLNTISDNLRLRITASFPEEDPDGKQ
jgi:hypothetical protein